MSVDHLERAVAGVAPFQVHILWVDIESEHCSQRHVVNLGLGVAVVELLLDGDRATPYLKSLKDEK